MLQNTAISKCFAAAYGDCSNKKSNEHFFTDAALKELGDSFVVDGLSWQQSGEKIVLPRTSLQSHVLCKTHNSLLNGLDDEAIKFFKAMKECSLLITGQKESSAKTFEIEGLKFERWTHKLLAGLLKSGNLMAAGKTWKDLKLNKIALDYIFKGEGMPPEGGFYFWSESTQFELNELLKVTPLVKPGSFYGIDIRFYGLRFCVSAFRPEFDIPENGRIVFRPDRIVFKNESSEGKINFIWPTKSKFGVMLFPRK